MAQGKIKKTTGKKISEEIKENVIIPEKEKSNLPELASQSFASNGLSGPSRIYQNGLSTNGEFDSMRYRFNNIWQGIMPFQNQQGFITIRDAIWLCQKAYFNIATFRNAINTLAELCNTDIYLDGGNQQSRDFFTAWFKRINLWKLKDMFFRELFRSGNVFFFRLDGDISKTDALKLSQTYGGVKDLQLPLRYIMLNVADIGAPNNITYDTPVYFKILTPQQIQILKKSKNSDDKEIYKNLSKSIKDYFDGGTGSNKAVPIDLSKLHTIFYQKQDYEPFAVPIGFGVLDDLNLKLEFKKTDAVLARTVEYITLLVTTGEKTDDKGNGGVNPKSLAALRELFSKEQVGRILVADYTTKLDWSIPDLSKVLGPEKYQNVNRDIADGLLDIFFGREAFANTVAKLKVFVEKLNRVQEIFINDFLQAEIRRVSELMNFKSYPTAKFIEVSLDDPTQMMRVFAQLIQLGVLTAKDGIEAMQTGELPSFDNLLQNQEAYKTLKDKGLFQPVAGSVQDQLKVVKETSKQQVALQDNKMEHDAKMADKQRKHDIANPAAPASPSIHIGGPGVKTTMQQPTGRPPGTKAPQTTKKVGPIGTGSETAGKISARKLIDNVRLMDKVKGQMLLEYKKEKGIRKLNGSHKQVFDQIVQTLFENEASDQWEEKINDYVSTPMPPNIDKILEIEEIASEHELSRDAATLFYHSKI